MSHQIKIQAEKLYKKYLKRIIKLVGNKTTYDKKLIKIGNKLFGKKFRGVFPSDLIPKINNGEFFIANLDTSYEQGSHWIGIVKDKKGLLIYDSFGRKSKTIIPSVYKLYRKVIDTEYDKEQKIKESNCGARSLSFLMVYYKKGFNYAKYI